jgi:hypothetical protein
MTQFNALLFGGIGLLLLLKLALLVTAAVLLLRGVARPSRGAGLMPAATHSLSPRRPTAHG